jgi:hypothetical protein
MRTPKDRQDPAYKRQAIGQSARDRVKEANERTVFYDDKVSLWAWPSRGGLIVLGNVTALDFSFLGLSAVHPPTNRDEDQEAEDKFCQQLLLLGAKWFDSRKRYGFVANVFADEEPEHEALEAGEESPLTLMERRWISVGWPSKGNGEFWIAEYDTSVYGVMEKNNLVPSEANQVFLARDMDEKCEILQGLGAKHYQSIEEYKGAACLNAWKQKLAGEFGSLVKY